MSEANQPRSLQEMAAEAGPRPSDGRVRMCPRMECGKRLFLVAQTWYLKDGTKRRGYKCAACGYVDSSTVTEVFDGDEQE